jgi:hypothetical protein
MSSPAEYRTRSAAQQGPACVRDENEQRLHYTAPRRSLSPGEATVAQAGGVLTRSGASAHPAGCGCLLQRRDRANSLRWCFRPDPSAGIRRDCWPPSPVPEGETRLVLFRPVNRRSSLVLSRATSGADRSAGAELAARASAQEHALQRGAARSGACWFAGLRRQISGWRLKSRALHSATYEAAAPVAQGLSLTCGGEGSTSMWDGRFGRLDKNIRHAVILLLCPRNN